MTKSVIMTWAEKLSVVGHLVRDAYRCMTKVVAAFTIARDPVDGGTWERHDGRRKLTYKQSFLPISQRDMHRAGGSPT